MNEAARKIIAMQADGTGDPLASEHLETLRAAFPIAMDHYTHVQSNASALVAFGYPSANGFVPHVTWVNEDGTAGYTSLIQSGQCIYEPEMTLWRKLRNKWREIKCRICKAWSILWGSNEE